MLAQRDKTEFDYMGKLFEAITRDGEVLTLSPNLGLRGRVLRVGWELPADLSEEDWREAGEMLGKIERSVSWWIGDWWAFGEARYGERSAVVTAEDWQGPDFKTCANAASVCRAFETSRRREVLSFKHHSEVAALPSEKADALLDWAAEPLESTGKPRSTLELRANVLRIKNAVGTAPSDETCTLTDLVDLSASGRKFGCIYADPPWLYDNQGTRAATSGHYTGMTVDELCAMPIRELAADDAHLHLWITNAFLFDAPRIFEAWGFEFRSTFVWCKPQMGIGNYWRNSHEIMLTAIRGDAKRFNDHSMMSWVTIDRGRHSSKPERIRDMIVRASGGPYLELFGRIPADGWTVFGNEIDRDIFATRGNMKVAAE